MFYDDLAVAHVVEQTVIPHLQRFEIGSTAWVNKLSPFICDLWWRRGAKALKVEVKYDRLVCKTGNVALEHASLTHSTAEFVVYVLAYPYPLFCLSTRKDVLKLLNLHRTVYGGDQPNNLLTLVPVQDFVKSTTLI